MALTFEWDDAKARANVRKHGVRFEEAAPHLATSCPSPLPTRITRLMRIGSYYWV